MPSVRRKKSTRSKRSPALLDRVANGVRRVRWWGVRAAAALFLIMVGWVGLYAFVNPPGGIYMLQEYRRLGAISRTWVPMDQIAPVMARSAVAAEDANFCNHWGFDMSAIRTAIDAGAARGASTISQQTVKNVFLWHGRDWSRKALEAAMTPLMETFWSKRRVLEVYLNIAEFDTGVFGVQAAARRYFNTDAAQLTATQAALLAAALPAPQSRNPAQPTDFMRRRAASIADGAATIQADGRANCFSG